MADDGDPPRKFYALRPREFERVNEPREPAPAEAAPVTEPHVHVTPKNAGAPDRIDLHEVIRQGQVPGPVLNPTARPTADNEVHALLRDNLAREAAKGIHQLAPKPRRRSKRRRDYWLLMGTLNPGFLVLAVHALHSGNAILLVYSVAGIGLCSAAVTWVMWFVMDDY